MFQFLAAVLLAAASVAQAAPGTREEIILVNASQASTPDARARHLRDGVARGRRLAMTAEMRNALLDKHNTLRSTMPDRPCTAADMLKMVWDDDLQKAAQDWADGCRFEHETAGNRENGWGENLAWTSAEDDSIAKMVEFTQLWYDEVEHAEWFESNTRVRAKTYDNSQERCPHAFEASTGKCMIGHYTQVVAANSHKIGCGVTICSSGDAGTLLVCKYSPAGNRGTDEGLVAPFQFGASCGSCASDCEQDLCQTAPVDKCVDQLGTAVGKLTVGNTPYTDCPSMLADGLTCDFIQAEESYCAKTCSECTPATKLGADFCGTAAGGSGSGSESGSGSGSGLLVSHCHKAATSWSTVIPWLPFIMLFKFLAPGA